MKIAKGTVIIAVGDNNWWYDTVELDEDMTLTEIKKMIKENIYEPDEDISKAHIIHIYKAEQLADIKNSR